MIMNASARRRWTSLLLCSGLVLGACGSGEPSASDDETSPSALALDEAADTTLAATDEGADEAMVADTGAFDLEEFTSLADLENVELTPEIFDVLKENEASRAAILEEMVAQGLEPDSAVCFLDEVSPGLFIAFGTGEQPTDEQFGELIALLDTCEIAFGAQS